MKRKSLVALILIVFLMFFVVSCNKTDDKDKNPVNSNVEKFNIQAGKDVFKLYDDLTIPKSVDSIFSTEDTFENFLGNKFILLSKLFEKTGETKQYSVINIDGETIIPFENDSSKNCNVQITLQENIFVCKLASGLNKVVDFEGKVLLDQFEGTNIKSIGNRYFKVENDEENDIYDINGKKIFSDLSRPLASKRLNSYDDYIVVENENSYDIFNEKSFLIKTLIFDKDNRNNLFYLGEGRFLLVENKTVKENEDYDFIQPLVNNNFRYVKQEKIYYSAKEKKVIDFKYKDEIIDFIVTRYTNNGLNLKDGCFYYYQYNVKKDKTLDEENVLTYILDKDLNKKIKYSKDILNTLRFSKQSLTGIETIISTRDKINSINLDCTIKKSIDIENLRYVDTLINDNCILVCKNIDEKEKFGVIDLSGNIKIPFEYDKLSNFCEGIAYGIKDNKSYKITLDGKATEIEDSIENIYNGFYSFTKNETKIIKDFNGKEIINKENIIDIYLKSAIYDRYHILVLKDKLDRKYFYKLA